jgi:hypothetical protein
MIINISFTSFHIFSHLFFTRIIALSSFVFFVAFCEMSLLKPKPTQPNLFKRLQAKSSHKCGPRLSRQLQIAPFHNLAPTPDSSSSQPGDPQLSAAICSHLYLSAAKIFSKTRA